MYLLLVIGSRAPRIAYQAGVVASVAVGSEGRLDNGMPIIPVARDETLVPELAGVVAANGGRPLSSLSSRVYRVENRTPVRVSESSSRGLRVRILAGSEKGRLGWVPADWVKPTM
jgi:hypothetical protein